MSNVQHSQGTDRWFTPVPIVERARAALGGTIDLDPASEPEAQARVRARLWFGQGSELGANALVEQWPEAPIGVFCNPPGSKEAEGGKSLVWDFWERIMVEREHGRLRAAIWIAFSLEQLQQSQNLRDRRAKKGHFAPQPMTDFPIAIPTKRIAYDAPEGGKKRSPTHASAIIYVPGTECDVARFADAFRDVGAIMVPGAW